MTAPTAPVVAFAEDVTPSCMCPLALTSSSAAVGSIASVSGNVLVSHTASFVAAEQNTPLSPGSRVVTGNKSSANLLIGGGCSVNLGANSSATIVRQEQQLCVRVVDQQKTASVNGQTLETRRAEYGQQGQARYRLMGAPEWMAMGAFIGAGTAALLDDDNDDDQCVSNC